MADLPLTVWFVRFAHITIHLVANPTIYPDRSFAALTQRLGKPRLSYILLLGSSSFAFLDSHNKFMQMECLCKLMIIYIVSPKNHNIFSAENSKCFLYVLRVDILIQNDVVEDKDLRSFYYSRQ